MIGEDPQGSVPHVRGRIPVLGYDPGLIGV